MKTQLFFLVAMSLLLSCSNSDVEKHYNAKDNVIDVRDKLQPIDFGEVYMSISTPISILNDYLIFIDHRSYDKLIHIFNKNTFEHYTSIGERGQGPAEIANMGDVFTDNEENTFYVIDHGHNYILSFPMDSVLNNPHYYAKPKVKIDNGEFPIGLRYVNDTLSYALYWHILTYNDYRPYVGTFNMQTGERRLMEYKGHPEVERKRATFDASVKHNIYVEGYWHHDLLTICSLDGTLKHVVYGSKWDNTTSNVNGYYEGDMMICGDKIISVYLSDRRFDKAKKANYPTKLIVFDLEGNYIATLDTGIEVIHFTYDEEKNRLIIVADDEMQFSYLDLDGVI